MNIVALEGDTREGLFVMADKSTGAVVRAYDNDPGVGFIVLRQNAQQFVTLLTGTRIESKTRTCILSGPVAILNAKCAEWSAKGRIPGTIITKEVLFSQLPDSMQQRPELDAQYAKRAGKDGVILTKDGQKIYQFRSYIENVDSPHAVDTRIQHDNVDEVRAQRESLRTSKVELEA